MPGRFEPPGGRYTPPTQPHVRHGRCCARCWTPYGCGAHRLCDCHKPADMSHEDWLGHVADMTAIIRQEHAS